MGKPCSVPHHPQSVTDWRPGRPPRLLLRLRRHPEHGHEPLHDDRLHPTRARPPQAPTPLLWSTILIPFPLQWPSPNAAPGEVLYKWRKIQQAYNPPWACNLPGIVGAPYCLPSSSLGARRGQLRTTACPSRCIWARSSWPSSSSSSGPSSPPSASPPVHGPSQLTQGPSPHFPPNAQSAVAALARPTGQHPPRKRTRTRPYEGGKGDDGSSMDI